MKIIVSKNFAKQVINIIVKDISRNVKKAESIMDFSFASAIMFLVCNEFTTGSHYKKYVMGILLVMAIVNATMLVCDEYVNGITYTVYSQLFVAAFLFDLLLIPVSFLVYSIRLFNTHKRLMSVKYTRNIKKLVSDLKTAALTRRSFFRLCSLTNEFYGGSENDYIPTDKRTIKILSVFGEAMFYDIAAGMIGRENIVSSMVCESYKIMRPTDQKLKDNIIDAVINNVIR